tara:strand:- start:1420 stop:2205 length:786 start_codon:yes stop_codon:yes gene_type:complete
MPVTKASEIDSKFIKKIEDQYGGVDMVNDYFDLEDSVYYKTVDINKETGGIKHKLIQLPSFGESLKKLSIALNSIRKLATTDAGKKDPKVADLLGQIRDTFNSYRTHLRKNYPDLYSNVKNQLEEISVTGGGVAGATFTPGVGAQYATPFAFNKNKKAKGTARNYYYKLGYKPVPKKIKGSGLEVKQLFQEENGKQNFQKKRINAFDSITTELNDIYKLVSNAKNKTIEYYKTNPESYTVVKPTDLIQDYLKDIKKLLTVK